MLFKAYFLKNEPKNPKSRNRKICQITKERKKVNLYNQYSVYLRVYLTNFELLLKLLL